MKAYRAIIRSNQWMLGGVKVHSSSWFPMRQNALDWADVVTDTNRQIQPSMQMKVTIQEGDVPERVMAIMGQKRITKKNPRRRAKRNPIPAALALLKKAEAAHYAMRRNPKRHRAQNAKWRSLGYRVPRSRMSTIPKKTRLQYRAEYQRTPRVAGIRKGFIKRGKRMTAQNLRRKVTDVLNKARRQFTRNPATKHIHLQEKRGASWITLAMFPLAQKAFAVKTGKQFHRRYPRKTLRLVS